MRSIKESKLRNSQFLGIHQIPSFAAGKIIQTNEMAERRARINIHPTYTVVRGFAVRGDVPLI
jgi:hypothetical protein